MTGIPTRYGIKEQVRADTDAARAAEDIRLLGFAIVPGEYDDLELDALTVGFDQVHASSMAAHGGMEVLAAIDEHNTIRAILTCDSRFLALARNPNVLAICAELLGEYYILNQQNGIINPPHGRKYNQAAWHRDLPYQLFVSSRPLALNALFCLDTFTTDNGATHIMPATHKQEASHRMRQSASTPSS